MIRSHDIVPGRTVRASPLTQSMIIYGWPFLDAENGPSGKLKTLFEGTPDIGFVVAVVTASYKQGGVERMRFAYVCTRHGCGWIPSDEVEVVD